MEVKQWDFVAYKIDGKIAVGTVLQCLDCRVVRVDTDGVIEKNTSLRLSTGREKT
jgi:hypothetical protein